MLAPVVAGTGPSAHPDIAAARRFVRGLDAAVAVTSSPTRGPLFRTVLGGVGWVTRLLLRGCRGHAAEMERGVAAAAAERAQAVDYGLRIVAQEQVGLAYAGWDRLLTRVALPAWRMGRWPSRLDAGVVAALTELSRRDRLAEGFASRLGERPACDLLEEPGTVDEAASLLAARLFHGGPAESGPDWSPVDWHEYPDEVVDRKWRTDAARLHRVLDTLGVHHTTTDPSRDPTGPTLARVLNHLAHAPTARTHAPEGHERHSGVAADHEPRPGAVGGREPFPEAVDGHRRPDADATTHEPHPGGTTGPLSEAPAAPAAPQDREHAHNPAQEPDRQHISRPDDADDDGDDDDEPGLVNAQSADLAAALTAELAREEAAAPAAVVERGRRSRGAGTGPGAVGRRAVAAVPDAAAPYGP